MISHIVHITFSKKLRLLYLYLFWKLNIKYFLSLTASYKQMKRHEIFTGTGKWVRPKNKYLAYNYLINLSNLSSVYYLYNVMNGEVMIYVFKIGEGVKSKIISYLAELLRLVHALKESQSDSVYFTFSSVGLHSCNQSSKRQAMVACLIFRLTPEAISLWN